MVNLFYSTVPPFIQECRDLYIRHLQKISHKADFLSIAEIMEMAQRARFDGYEGIINFKRAILELVQSDYDKAYHEYTKRKAEGKYCTSCHQLMVRALILANGR